MILAEHLHEYHSYRPTESIWGGCMTRVSPEFICAPHISGNYNRIGFFDDCHSYLRTWMNWSQLSFWTHFVFTNIIFTHTYRTNIDRFENDVMAWKPSHSSIHPQSHENELRGQKGQLLQFFWSNSFLEVTSSELFGAVYLEFKAKKFFLENESSENGFSLPFRTWVKWK